MPGPFRRAALPLPPIVVRLALNAQPVQGGRSGGADLSNGTMWHV